MGTLEVGITVIAHRREIMCAHYRVRSSSSCVDSWRFRSRSSRCCRLRASCPCLRLRHSLLILHSHRLRTWSPRTSPIAHPHLFHPHSPASRLDHLHLALIMRTSPQVLQIQRILIRRRVRSSRCSTTPSFSPPFCSSSRCSPPLLCSASRATRSSYAPRSRLPALLPISRSFSYDANLTLYCITCNVTLVNVWFPPSIYSYIHCAQMLLFYARTFILWILPIPFFVVLCFILNIIIVKPVGSTSVEQTPYSSTLNHLMIWNLNLNRCACINYELHIECTYYYVFVTKCSCSYTVILIYVIQ